MFSFKSAVVTERNIFTQTFPKPYGVSRDGFSRTECVTTFILTSAEFCESNQLPILGKIRAVIGALYQSEDSDVDSTLQSLAIQDSLEIAKVYPTDISYLELHGPVTQEGDMEEYLAVRSVFSGQNMMSIRIDRPLYVGTMAGTIGDTEVASGLVGILKTLMTLTNGVVAGCMGRDNTYDFDPSCDVSSLDGVTMPHSTMVANFSGGTLFGSVHGFGINGYAGHVVVEVDEEVRNSWKNFVELRCSDDNYTVHPPIESLRNLSSQQLSSVESFSIQFPNGNKVEWIEPVDLRSIGDLSLFVMSDDQAVDVYPEGLAKPAAGKGLNKAAVVTLQNISCSDNKSVEEFCGTLKRTLEGQKATLMAYTRESRRCTFRVESFEEKVVVLQEKIHENTNAKAEC
jgi:hypothetical protein